MSSYVITGVSRGLGWEILDQISSIPSNTVIGIVRNKAVTDKSVTEELSGRSNITIVEADLGQVDTLKRAAAEAAVITGGSLDYLIANAANVSTWDNFDPIGTLVEKPEFAGHFSEVMHTNVLANIQLYNAFMPQILKGKAKKVLSITSGLGDSDWTRDWDIENAAVYSISKAAMNMVTAKYSAQYKKEGVLFLGICPGMVEVGHYDDLSPEEKEGLSRMVNSFKEYAPDFKGPDQPKDSVKAILSVLDSRSIANGDGGAFLSHFGNKQWIK